MAELLCKEGDLEVRLESSHSIEYQDLLFFHSNEFISRNNDSTPLFFNLYVAGKNLASIVFEVIDQVATSLPLSPFGGMMTGQIVDTPILNKLLQVIIDYFSKNKCNVQITLPPGIYSTYSFDYLNLGFEVKYQDVNQHIPIDKEDLHHSLNRNRKRKLVLNNDQGYQFLRLNLSHLEEAYKLIKECRIDKGYPVTMSLNELQNAFSSFPYRYLLFGVYDGSELIASAVSIRVSKNILYNFYHGDRLSHRSTGPVTLLVAGIYEYCQEQNIEILDLGISSQHGELNEGLFYFKRSCGAVSTDKFSYQLEV